MACTPDDSVVEAQGQHVPLEHEPGKAQAGEGDQRVPNRFSPQRVFVMFAYSGWNVTTYVAEEMKTPESTLPAAVVSGTLLVAVFYLALNAAFLYALPLE